MPKVTAHSAQAAPNVDLVVAWKRGAGYEFKRIKTAGEADKKLVQIIDAADARVRRAAHRKPYSIGDDIEGDEAMVIGYDALPQRVEVRRTKWASTKRPAEFRMRMVTFEEEPGGEYELRTAADEGRPIAFYAIVRGLGPADRTAYLRHRNPMAQVKPGAFFLALGETLTTIDTGVFTMDDHVDVVLGPTEAVIFGKSFFDLLFFELSAADADQHEDLVKEVLSELPFEAGTLAALVGSIQNGRRARRRMLTMRESAHLKDMTMKDFRSALGKHGIPAGRFIRKGEIVSSEDDLGGLLEILNEDLYDGYLTGRPLVVSKKGLKRM